MTPKKSSTPKKTKAKAPQPETAQPETPTTPKAKRAAPRRKAVPSLQVFIDYPREGELVRPGHYSIRVGTVPAAASVELSIDGGVWIPCRESAGYWWYDWSGFEIGPHQIQARAQGESPVPVTAERYVNVTSDAETAAA